MTWGVGMGGGRDAQEEGDIYTLMTDSQCCMAETQHNIVKQLPSKFKKKKKKKRVQNDLKIFLSVG